MLSDGGGVDGGGGWSRGHLRAVLQLAGRLQRRGRQQELAQLLGNFVADDEANLSSCDGLKVNSHMQRPALAQCHVHGKDKTCTLKSLTSKFGGFDLSTALFCGGLAFDAYVEPPSNSSRWEKGSQGLNVAFVSAAFARQLYKGVVEIAVQKCTGLPEEESGAERLLTGKGADACVLVAAVEGSWEEDVKLLEKEQFHEGVLDLSGAAHVG